MLSQVKVIWLGSLIAISNNELTVPFMTLDNSPKSSNTVPLDGSLQKLLLDDVNTRLGEANELTGVSVGSNIDTNGVRIDLTAFLESEVVGSNMDFDEVFFAIQSKIFQYGKAVKLDENNRVAYMSFNTDNNVTLEFEGDLFFNDDASLQLTVKTVSKEEYGQVVSYTIA